MSKVRTHLQEMVKRGLSQMEIQRRSGVSQPTICRILSGERTNLQLHTAEKLLAIRPPRVKKPKAPAPEQVTEVSAKE